MSKVETKESNMDKKEILQIPIADVVQKINSRMTYDKSDLAELMTSMRQRGLFSPIGVRYDDDTEKYEVVFGNRRYLAAKKLDWKVIDCVIAEAQTDDDFLIVNAIENLQRKDVPLAEQGRIFKALMTGESKLSHKEIAAKIGIEPQRVSKIMQLYDKIPPELRPKVVLDGRKGNQSKHGNIPMETASKAISLSTKFGLDKKQTTDLLKMGAKDHVTGRTMSAAAALMRAGKSLEEAMEKAEQIRIVGLNVALDAKHSVKLEEEYGLSIRDILYNALKQQKFLKIIHLEK